MGYEKEKAIERQDKLRVLASALRGSSRATLDFGDSDSFRDARAGVQGVLIELIAIIADGGASYLTIGKSRDGGAILITVNGSNGAKQYAGGTNWDKLGAELDALFA